MKILITLIFLIAAQASFANCSTDKMKSRVKLLSGTATRMYSSPRSFLSFAGIQEFSAKANQRFGTEFVADRPTMIVLVYDTSKNIQPRFAIYSQGDDYKNATDFVCQPGLCSISVMEGAYNLVFGNKSSEEVCFLIDVYQRRL